MSNLSNRLESENNLLGIPKKETLTLTAAQTEVPQLLEKKDIANYGRVIVVLSAVEENRRIKGISRERLESYVYILSQAGIVPVGYHFTFEPMPFSDDLDEGLVRDRGYISHSTKNGNVLITEEGKKWVDEALGEDKSKVFAPIQELVQKLKGISPRGLFNICCRASRIEKVAAPLQG